MAREEREPFTLEELADQPGTYFNPQTEVVIVVDDSVSIDPEIFDLELEGDAEWVRLGDDVPVDEQARDEIFERYEKQRQPEESDEDYDEVDELEPDPDPYEDD